LPSSINLKDNASDYQEQRKYRQSYSGQISESSATHDASPTGTDWAAGSSYHDDT